MPDAIAAPATIAESRSQRLERWLPHALTLGAFAILFAKPAVLLVQEWWTNPEAGHGLLLAPIAIWLAWRAGIREDATGDFAVGLAALLVAVLVRYTSGLAAELFTMRISMVLAMAALVILYFGVRQVVHWWLPFTLMACAVPLPELIRAAIALPLQFEASQLGAALLRTRGVPVLLEGNVISIPGYHLFVTEACSGLRSLTALMSLGVLLGGMKLRSPLGRAAIVGLAIPIAVAINGVRVFLTGFLMLFVSPKLGEGFMHASEGWLLFVVSFICLGAITWVVAGIERRVHRLRISDA
jgi:exosortase